MCARDAQSATAIAVMAKGIPQRGFKAAIDEVRRAGRPFTLDVADSAISKLGGAAIFGNMIAEDIMAMRGDGLDPSLKAHLDIDYRAIKGMYEALLRLIGDRDELVGAVDPLDGVPEEDLMAVASQAAEFRLESDAEFRKQLLYVITQLDPDAVIEAAANAIDLVNNRPTVFVVDRA